MAPFKWRNLQLAYAPFPYAAIIENGAIKKGAILNGTSHLQHHLNMTPYGARSIRPPWRHLRHMAPFSVFAKWKMAMRHFYRHQRHLMAPDGAKMAPFSRHMAHVPIWHYCRVHYVYITRPLLLLYNASDLPRMIYTYDLPPYIYISV